MSGTSGTPRTQSYLLTTEFQDGQTAGSITPQDMRDFVVSVQPWIQTQGPVVSILGSLPSGQPNGSTDNSTAIQAAINAAAGVCTLWFPVTASPYIASGITIPSNSRLIIDGTIKMTPAAGHVNFLQTTNSSNVVVEGFGTLDGNGSNQTGVSLLNCFYTNASSNVLVRGLTLQNSKLSGCNIFVSTNVLIDNCKILNNGFASQFTGVTSNGFPAGFCDRCWIRNSYIAGTNDYGWAFYDGVTNSGISGCVSTGGASVGIGILSDGGSNYCSNVIICDNICYSNQYGIGVSVATLTGVHSHIIIDGNECYSNSAGGIIISAVSDVAVSNNNVHDNAGTAGIFVGNTPTPSAYRISNNNVRANSNGIALYNGSNGSVVGNSISNSGTGGAGILCNSGTLANTFISSNNIFDDQGSPTQIYGFNGTGYGSGAVVVNNTIANATTPYNVTPATDTIIVNAQNVIYFYASLSSAQTITGATATKIDLDTVVFDTAGAYDHTTNFRYTAKTAGKYKVMVTMVGSASAMTAGGNWISFVYKNGSPYAKSVLTAANANSGIVTAVCVATVALNGSTDYIEGWGQVPGTSATQFNPSSGGNTSSMTIEYLGA